MDTFLCRVREDSILCTGYYISTFFRQPLPGVKDGPSSWSTSLDLDLLNDFPFFFCGSLKFF